MVAKVTSEIPHTRHKGVSAVFGVPPPRRSGAKDPQEEGILGTLQSWGFPVFVG